VAEQRGDELLRLALGFLDLLGRRRGKSLEVTAQRLFKRVAPGGKVIPSRTPGCLGIRCNYLDPGFQQVRQSRMLFGFPSRTRKTMVEV
jgi:hypothetical protein